MGGKELIRWPHYIVRASKQRKAKIQAREAVVLLEQARVLLSEDNAVQLAIKQPIRQLVRPTDGQLC